MGNKGTQEKDFEITSGGLLRYKIKRSNRKTIGLEITKEGLLVRAPLRASKKDIERVVNNHQEWIREKTVQMEQTTAAASEKGLLSQEDIYRLAEEAMRYIPERVAYYAPQLGVRPGRITIRNQKTRWGSCSKKGNLNFNCLLMMAPGEVIDSVVVHELCHLIEMNHSAKFYEQVLRVFPDYYKHHAWLKENGPEIMARGHGG